MGNPLILLLCLEGPLQSWGERARWEYRDTAAMPTKSAVIGLLACAMGVSRRDSKLLEMERTLTVGIRADRPGRILTDYHTISGIINTADGGQRAKKGEESTIVSSRQYLQDAAFLVAVHGEEKLLRACAAVLKHPVWPIFLGRKCCIPTRPVLEALTDAYSSLDEALQSYPLISTAKNESVLCEIEDIDGAAYRYDRITNSPVRSYAERRVRTFPVKPPKEVITG